MNYSNPLIIPFVSDELIHATISGCLWYGLALVRLVRQGHVLDFVDSNLSASSAPHSLPDMCMSVFGSPNAIPLLASAGERLYVFELYNRLVEQSQGLVISNTSVANLTDVPAHACFQEMAQALGHPVRQLSLPVVFLFWRHLRELMVYDSEVGCSLGDLFDPAAVDAQAIASTETQLAAKSLFFAVVYAVWLVNCRKAAAFELSPSCIFCADHYERSELWSESKILFSQWWRPWLQGLLRTASARL